MTKRVRRLLVMSKAEGLARHNLTKYENGFISPASDPSLIHVVKLKDSKFYGTFVILGVDKAGSELRVLTGIRNEVVGGPSRRDCAWH